MNLNITWAQFAICNDDPTNDFENMCRRLFKAKYLNDAVEIHSDHNMPGIEVIPVLEPVRLDGKPRRRISFQAKYVEQPKYAYAEFKKSACQTVKKFRGEVDCVYLFCNKTLTTTSKAYKSIEKIFIDAGIQVVPITNNEILDLVCENEVVKKYFFTPRTGGKLTQATNYPGEITMVSVIGSINISQDAIAPKPESSILLKKLVAEKIEVCNRYACNLEMEALKAELDKLFAYDVDNVGGIENLYFLRALTLLDKGIDASDLDKCGAMYKKETEWLMHFYATPFGLEASEFTTHLSVIQVFVIDKLFTTKQWNHIKVLYQEVKDCVDKSISDILCVYYGLSLFNLRENKAASVTLHALYNKTKKRLFQIYAVLADISVENATYQNGEAGHHEILSALITDLDLLSEEKQFKQQEQIISILKLEAFFHLGKQEKNYIEKAKLYYESLSESVKSDPAVRFYYALCLELDGLADKALEIYGALDWQNESVLAERYMLSLILNGQSDQALAVYKLHKNKNVRVDGVYLLALNSINSSVYANELQKLLKAYKGNLLDFIQLVCYIDKKSVAQKYVVPVLKGLITQESLHSLPFHNRIEFINFLAHCQLIDIMEMVLNTIENVACINCFTVSIIYKTLFTIVHKEYGRKAKEIDENITLAIVERIASQFLLCNVERALFLNIKVLCASANHLPISSLQYAKELFDLTHDLPSACIVVEGLCNRDEKKFEEYEPYLDCLKNSDEPEHSMLLAHAMSILGNHLESDYYAYKALYLANGNDNIYIYKNYFSLLNRKLYDKRESELTVIDGSAVVLLEEVGMDSLGQSRTITLCLDSESVFADAANRSMGIEHLSFSDTDYIKLQGCGLKSQLVIRNKNYQVVKIFSRLQFGLLYVLKKMQKNPKLYSGLIWTIPTDDIDAMFEQIKQLTDNSKHVQSILAAYHFKNNRIGLPLDVFANGDYSRYIGVLRFLLYQKDEAFYAGQPVLENEERQLYVPSLATLVLLAVLGRMDLFMAFEKDVIIPESYIAFFQKMFENALATQQVSLGILGFKDGKPYVTDNDTTLSEIWETILDFCKTCERKSVTDKERMRLDVMEGLSVERLIAEMRLSTIHLDALLLAKREKATLISDDLFFRNVAGCMHIRNLNIVSLVMHYTNSDGVFEFLTMLSKTNYIYVPLFYRTDAEAQELYHNVMEGKLKQLYYGDILRGNILSDRK